MKHALLCAGFVAVAVALLGCGNDGTQVSVSTDAGVGIGTADASTQPPSDPDAQSGIEASTPDTDATTSDDAGTPGLNGLSPTLCSDDSDAGPVAPGWVWYDVPGTACGNGSQTGMAVSVGTTDDLVIFLEGGGACWDSESCAGLDQLGVPIAANFATGYGGQTFCSKLAQQWPQALPTTNAGIFDRTAANNPFANSNFVYVPYCTGDVHAGSNVLTQNGKTLHFVGGDNVVTDIPYLTAAFPKTSHVTLAGRSAGGYGTQFNFWRVQNAFGSATVDVIDDAGPMFLQQFDGVVFSASSGAIRDNWNVAAAIPPGCSDCQTNIDAIPTWYGNNYPNSRFSFLSYDEDATLSTLTAQLPANPVYYNDIYRYAGHDGGSMPWRLPTTPNQGYYIVDGTHHTTLGYVDKPDAGGTWGGLNTTSGAIDLGTWLGQMVNRSASWQDVTPQTGTH